MRLLKTFGKPFPYESSSGCHNPNLAELEATRVFGKRRALLFRSNSPAGQHIYSQVFFDSIFGINFLEIFQVIGSGTCFKIEKPKELKALSISFKSCRDRPASISLKFTCA